MRYLRSWLLLMWLAALACAGCGGEGDDCTPGDSESCVCGSGGNGSRSCDIDGRWTFCTCGDADSDADLDLDSDSDVDSDVDTDADTDCDASGEGYWEPAWAALECEILRLTNEYRAAGADCGSEGVWPPAEPLVMQAQLREAARYHSLYMGEQGSKDDFSHDSPGGPNGDKLQDRLASAGYTDWRSIGENIAAGRPTAAQTMTDWMGSDGHCRNIMFSGKLKDVDTAFTEIGVGYASVPGSYYVRYWTQDFGRKP